MTRFLFERQQLPDGSMPRNSLVNGKPAPDSFGTQLDECAYPILMALQSASPAATFYTDHIKPAADFVATHGPSFGAERWEEQSGFSPVDDRRRDRRPGRGGADRRRSTAIAHGAAVWRGVADDFQRYLKELDGDHQRPARARGRTSSGCRRPATRTPRSPTTSATAARRSTSAR